MLDRSTPLEPNKIPYFDHKIFCKKRKKRRSRRSRRSKNDDDNNKKKEFTPQA